MDRGHEVTLTLLGSSTAPTWTPVQSKIIAKSRSRIVQLGHKALKLFGVDTYPLALCSRLAKLTPDCDINVATYCYTAYAVTWSERGIPFFHMQHYEPIFFDNPYKKRLAKQTYDLRLNKIANSEWLQKQIQEA